MVFVMNNVASLASCGVSKCSWRSALCPKHSDYSCHPKPIRFIGLRLLFLKPFIKGVWLDWQPHPQIFPWKLGFLNNFSHYPCKFLAPEIVYFRWHEQKCLKKWSMVFYGRECGWFSASLILPTGSMSNRHLGDMLPW